jgi:hypothetical protein
MAIRTCNDARWTCVGTCLSLASCCLRFGLGARRQRSTSRVPARPACALCPAAWSARTAAVCPERHGPPCTEVGTTVRSCPGTARCARPLGLRSKAGSNLPDADEAYGQNCALDLRFSVRRRWELNPRPGFCRPLPEPLGYAAVCYFCWSDWLLSHGRAPTCTGVRPLSVP